ncbi:metacaspase-3-like isoform X1 [Juglans microcarpa x Juglans regia]|uniref:metacaspase-3-like isoform X1 n=1 Tax=Juglans microcarpa x Juglans regia TaxID=2249226 RepID=UPI001B7E6D92|nr:metacaspase-3-like isoform X1 [Juglans microcarpa x Juglans regia]
MEGTATCTVCKKVYRMPKLSETIHCTECNAVTRITRSSNGSGLGHHFIESVLNSKPNLLPSRNSGKNHQGRQKNKQQSSSSSSSNTASPSTGDSSSLYIKPSPAVLASAEAISGRKRALLCGVTYRNKNYSLSGTINDVRSIKSLLIQRFGYPGECIRVLTEEENGNDLTTPTRKNIEDSLKWLVEGAESGDSLVFFFSGHGLRQPDFKNDELDGFDETICPVDFIEQGMIVDNDINSTIVRPLKEGVTLHAIVDACHSGTVLDLEYTYDLQNKGWKDNKPPSKAEKGTSGGLAICLSACEDDQMAADTNALTSKKEMNGAMTAILFRMVEKDPEITYEVLLNKMHDFIQQFNNKRFLINNRFLQRLFHRRKIEEPLLSSSQEFQVSARKFLR